MLKPGMIIKTKFQRLRLGIVLRVGYGYHSVICLNSDLKIVEMNSAYIQCLN